MSPQHHAFFDARVLADAYLAADNDILLDYNAAGEAGLRGDHDILSYLAIVADVNKVVDLRAAADAGNFQRATVDGGVGADLNIIADFERPICGNFS